MDQYRTLIRLLAIGCVIATVAGVLFLSGTKQKQKWRVTAEGLLDYPPCTPDYEITPLEIGDNYTWSEVRFTSRDMQIAGLVRIPTIAQGKAIPGIVLLSGATVTNEGEQGLATYLCGLGYASLALDQRNVGVIDIPGDLHLFLNGNEPTEHDYLAALKRRILLVRNFYDLSEEEGCNSFFTSAGKSSFQSIG